MALNDILTSMDGARDALVTAINAKGGSLADNATLYQCADAVGSLSGGISAEYYKCASVAKSDTLSVNIPNNTELSGVYTYNSSNGRYVNTNGAFFLHDGNYWVLVGTNGYYYCQSDEIASDTTPVDATGWKLSSGSMGAIDMAVTIPSTWSGYKAVFDSTAGTWSFESGVTSGLTYTSVTPIVGGIYSADALIKISSMWNGVPSSNLVFYLPLSETTIADVGPELTSSGTIVHTVMNGIPCAYFNGNSYLYASSVSMPTGASPRAMSLWFKYKDIPGTTSSDASLFAGWGTTTNLGRFDAYVEAQELYIIYSSGLLDSGIKIQDTNWHHVLLQYDGSTSEIYYDGQLAASEAKTLDTKNNYLYVGARENGEYAFDGYLAGIRIYNRAMSGTEIAYLVSEFTPTT